MRPLILPIALAALLALQGTALAHVSLTGSTPAANAKVAAPPRIVLQFSDRLIGATVRTDVVMTAMPGMTEHPPMKIAHTSQLAGDGKALTLVPKRALVKGTYKVTWSSAGADTHRMGSSFSFTVR